VVTKGLLVLSIVSCAGLATAYALGATIPGTNRSDLIRGTPGADVIHAGAGNDRIYGGAGNDRIYGGPGADVVWCGSGVDRVYADRTDRVARDCEVVAEVSVTATATADTTIASATATAITSQQGGPRSSEVQRVTLRQGDGRFTLTFEGQTTRRLPWDASADVVQIALTALTTIGPGNVAVSRVGCCIAGGGTYIFLFQGRLDSQNVSSITYRDVGA
jgi:Ca2+-binding RTX toxin-like protein